MNCTNLVKFVAVAATAALWGCASAPTPTAQHTADVQQVDDKDLDNTRIAWTECVRAAIPRFNNPQTSADAVARAAMKSCSDEYTAMIGVVARTLPPSCSKDANCKRGAVAKASRDATKTATDDVVTARVRVAGVQSLKCQ